MKKKTLIIILGALGLYFLVLLYFGLEANDFWGNILMPLGPMVSGIFLLYVYLKSDKRRLIFTTWLLYALACFVYMAGVLWAVMETSMGIDPSENAMMLHIYSLPNLLILVSVLMFAFRQFKRWNAAKLMLDTVMLTMIVSMLVWVIMFRGNPQNLAQAAQESPFAIMDVVIDLMIITLQAIWLLTMNRGRVPAYILTVSAGVLLYCLSDLVYYYVEFNQIYVPNGIVDVMYVTSFLLLGAGALIGRQTQTIGALITDNIFASSRKVLIRDLVIIAVPVAAIWFNGGGIADTLIFAALYLIYKGLGLYISNAAKKEELLAKEKRLNNELEAIITHHTQTLLDINDELSAKNQKLQFLSDMDALTNLNNRRYLMEKLEEKIGAAKHGETVAVFYIDMDRFKVINDAYGHSMGDRVLIEVSKRLTALAGEDTLLARMGGDEFVYAASDHFDNVKVSKIAKHIIDTCGDKIYIDDYVFSPAMSIGISIFPFDAQDVSTLMKNADIALYHAKEQGVNRFSVFSQLIKDKSQKRNRLEMMLKAADVEKDFCLYYQPQFSIPDKKLVAAEALIRWNSKELGMIMPGEFIQIAEETDHINKIGLWVFKEAVAQAKRWNETYGGGLKVGVNISPKQLNSTELMEELDKLMQNSAFRPEWVDIEITESVALEGDYRLTQIFDLFKAAGMSVSVDDFGTGYSSVLYLKSYNFDRIKIAKPLIDAVSHSMRDAQIVKGIILLAKTIGMTAIAEGVETQAQLDMLTQLGCDQIQGFLLGHPVPADEFEKLYLAAQTESEAETAYEPQTSAQPAG